MMLRTAALVLGFCIFVGCGKNIGDSCKSVNECISTDTDRLCLTQDGEGFPGGYCTKFNCGGSNLCPEEAACVAYRSTLGAGACEEAPSRLQRNYCMLLCDSDDDCRGGYRCLPADGDNPLAARIIDNHVGRKICALEYFVPTDEPPRSSEVCEAAGLYGLGDAAASSESPLDAGGDGGAAAASSQLPDASGANDASP